MPTPVERLIQQLGLEPHIEGGYYRRTFASTHATGTPEAPRAAMSAIYYLLTRDQPIGHFHCNRSDILHCFHGGSALTYYLVSPDGELRITRLGMDVETGEFPQLLVPGGTWKATHLTTGDHGLLSEAVCPGFDWQDMTLATGDQFQQLFPQHWPALRHLIKNDK